MYRTETVTGKVIFEVPKRHGTRYIVNDVDESVKF